MVSEREDMIVCSGQSYADGQVFEYQYVFDYIIAIGESVLIAIYGQEEGWTQKLTE